MLAKFFHAWERRLAAVTTNRLVRPFEWGLDWIPPNGHPPDRTALARLEECASSALADSAAFFEVAPATEYELDGDHLRFPSACLTPHAQNNTVHARLFRSRPDRADGPRRAVVVLPQWNADAGGHVGLCRLLAAAGLTALRLSLPYHDRRMPPELQRADFIVSSNVGRTLQVCRQAVMDARRAVSWLAGQGFERIGILGTSLGSCLAMLTACHEPLVKAAALNHVSPFFADVVWSGLSTSHVRAGLEGHIDLETLRRLWLPISPHPYIERIRHAKVLLVYARYDLTFPVELSRSLIGEFRRLGVPHEVAALPCGHYSTGVSPFKWMDGWILVRFLRRTL